MKKILILVMLLFPFSSFSQDMGNYLITNDIGSYKFRPKPTKRIYGNSGVLIPTGHFYVDHEDVTYETEYILPSPLLGVDVQITQHTNSDSDKWLLHEVVDSYRDNDNADGRLGLLSGVGVKLREVGGNKFIYWGLGGGSYTWISGQKVIEIKYTDLQRTKPEPIEVIQVYLQKHPSTIPSSFVFDQAHDVQWIKDEMDRRFWLCDKWFMQLQLGKVQQNEVFQQAVKSMTVFLDYREKYFSIKAANDKNLLVGYLNTNNGTGIKAKLTEYKNWWSVNREKAINL